MAHAVLDVCQEELAGLPSGSIVAINAETGELVADLTIDAALAAFEARFGWGVPACVQTVREARGEPAGPAARC